MKPSTTAAIYRVAYRRADRDPRKGYTYRLFKSETPARSFMERLLTPPTDKTPEKYAALAPIAEAYLHFCTVHWSEVTDRGEFVNRASKEGLVFHSGEYIDREAALARLGFLAGDRTNLVISLAQREASAAEYQALFIAMDEAGMDIPEKLLP